MRAVARRDSLRRSPPLAAGVAPSFLALGIPPGEEALMMRVKRRRRRQQRQQRQWGPPAAAFLPARALPHQWRACTRTLTFTQTTWTLLRRRVGLRPAQAPPCPTPPLRRPLLPLPPLPPLRPCQQQAPQRHPQQIKSGGSQRTLQLPSPPPMPGVSAWQSSSRAWGSPLLRLLTLRTGQPLTLGRMCWRRASRWVWWEGAQSLPLPLPLQLQLQLQALVGLQSQAQARALRPAPLLPLPQQLPLLHAPPGRKGPFLMTALALPRPLGAAGMRVATAAAGMRHYPAGSAPWAAAAAAPAPCLPPSLPCPERQRCAQSPLALQRAPGAFLQRTCAFTRPVALRHTLPPLPPAWVKGPLATPLQRITTRCIAVGPGLGAAAGVGALPGRVVWRLGPWGQCSGRRKSPPGLC